VLASSLPPCDPPGEVCFYDALPGSGVDLVHRFRSLGDLEVLPRIEIRWPDGEILEGRNLVTRPLVTVRHSGAELS